MFIIDNVLLLFGNEKYLLEKRSQEIINKTVSDSFYDFNVSKFNFENLNTDNLYNSIQTLPLMSNNKVVIVDNMLLDKGSISKFKNIFDSLLQILKDIPTTTYILFISNTRKPFNGKFFKELKKNGKVITCNRLDRKNLGLYISEYLKINSRKDSDIINYIIDKSGYLIDELNMNLFDLNNELDKINNLNKGYSKIDVEKTLTKANEFNIFNLTDSILEKSLKNSLKIYHSLLLENDDPFKIFYMIVRSIRNILIIKESRRRGLNNFQITDRFSISNFEIKKIDRFINIWSYKNLKEGIHKSYEIELGLKSLPIKPKIQIENFIMDLCI